MKRSTIHRTSREPIDRRQLRLIHALLAFPVAGVIGFAGNAIVKSVFTESLAIASPVPERSTDEHTSPDDPKYKPDTDAGAVSAA
ncbi:MAG TPA: hypothetical protein VFT39_14065 [Vicinamibacterales bacterium]|nr:hypothetical protein [Vicinamibacterales bacterium]